MPIWIGFGFQDSCSYLMEQLSFFHDHSMVVLIFVRFLVIYFVFSGFFFTNFDKGISEGHEIEFIWTILPALILIFIAIPSLKILYLIDEEFGQSLNYKVTGHQWYWSYEYIDCLSLGYDSYINSTNERRLFDTDNRLYAPYCVPLRFMVTSQDVIHSWTIPSLGVKSDALPGRLNQIIFICSRPGLYFGQCSELCGVNHRFIPISLEVRRTEDYLIFLKRD